MANTLDSFRNGGAGVVDLLDPEREQTSNGHLLAISLGRLRGGFAQFQLCAHFLKTGLQGCYFFLQLLHSRVLFEKFVEQHRVHSVIAHRVWFAIPIINHQVGIHFGNVFGDQTKLRYAFSVILIVERDRFERQNGFTGSVHRLDIFLEAPRRSSCAQLAIRRHDDWQVTAGYRGYAINASDPRGVAHIRASDGRTDTGDVICRTDVCAGISSQRRVVVAGGVGKERLEADCGVVVAGGVAKERTQTVGGVVAAGGEVE